MTARIHAYDDAETLINAVLPPLVENEASNTLLIGLLLALQRGEMALPAYAVRVEARGGVSGAALLLPPMGLFITDLDDDGAYALAADVAQRGYAVHGIIGPQASARRLATALGAHDGRPAPRVQMAQHIHVATRVENAPNTRGVLRVVTPAHADLAHDWCRAFALDCQLEHIDAEAKRLSNKWRHGDLFLWWLDDEPVCLVGVAGHSPHGARVGPVYTPSAARKRGFGTAATAALTQHLLDGGLQFCCLFTDVKNPTSNKIYASIGYRVVGESAHLVRPLA